jgi:hypothetical protein
MTKYSQTLLTAGTVVDFTTGPMQVWDYGTTHPFAGPTRDYTNLAQSTLTDGKRAMWYGNSDPHNGAAPNQYNKVKYEAPDDDQSYILSDVLFNTGNTSVQSGYDFCKGYYAGDVDLSGKAKYEAPYDDRSLILYQILFYPLNTSYQSAFDFLLEQLP